MLHLNKCRCVSNMIRNHLFDPENSPPPKAGGPAFFNPSAYDNGSPSKPSEDPWYSGNGRESPMYSYGSYGNGGDQQQYPQQSYAAASTSFIDATEDDYDNEPPLLEELGIRFDHIWSKTHAVINLKQVRRSMPLLLILLSCLNVHQTSLRDADIII